MFATATKLADSIEVYKSTLDSEQQARANQPTSELQRLARGRGVGIPNAGEIWTAPKNINLTPLIQGQQPVTADENYGVKILSQSPDKKSSLVQVVDVSGNNVGRQININTAVLLKELFEQGFNPRRQETPAEASERKKGQNNVLFGNIQTEMKARSAIDGYDLLPNHVWKIGEKWYFVEKIDKDAGVVTLEPVICLKKELYRRTKT